ncbi:MAG: peptidase M22 [Hominenteromicrobium sp.]
MLDFCTLGIDTSNYTTSAAFLENGSIDSRGKLLPVKAGEIGLRQSDAVFHHTRQLPEVMEQLGDQIGRAKAIGVSNRPRDAEDSYMPCFLVGLGTAQMLGQALRVPVHRFSHQQGHIAAALYSANQLTLLKRRFLAFHLSGGTTEAVLVEPGPAEKIFSTKLAASSLDLKAGQVIDRVGVMLGLPFPAGRHLDPLACAYTGKVRAKASMKDENCSLSGVENKCRALMAHGAPKEEIAATCMAYVLASVDGMCAALLKTYGDMPVLFSGGVSSNSMMRAQMTAKYGAVFAEPRFSADNAAGAAVLASLREEGF